MALIAVVIPLYDIETPLPHLWKKGLTVQRVKIVVAEGPESLA